MKNRNLSFKHFNQKINYSSCNEDTFSELKALEIKKKIFVLAILGTEGRP